MNNPYKHPDDPKLCGKINDKSKVVEVIERLKGRASSYENAASQTKNDAKKETCMRVAAEMRYLSWTLSLAFVKEEEQYLHISNYADNNPCVCGFCNGEDCA